MLNINVKTETVVTRDHTVRLNGKDIIFLLRQELKSQGVKTDLPDNAEVEFHVPGGGDYSNCSLNVDDDNAVTVTWSEKSDG